MGTSLKEKPRTTKIPSGDLLQIVQGYGGSLIMGTDLKCPGCENVTNILDYLPLEHSEKYANQIVIPLKCRNCRHVFALKP